MDKEKLILEETKYMKCLKEGNQNWGQNKMRRGIDYVEAKMKRNRINTPPLSTRGYGTGTSNSRKEEKNEYI